MPSVRVDSVDIQVHDSMKYLRVIVNSSWNFKNHFSYLEDKIAKVIRALSRLMSNLGKPGERKR